MTYPHHDTLAISDLVRAACYPLDYPWEGKKVGIIVKQRHDPIFGTLNYVLDADGRITWWRIIYPA